MLGILPLSIMRRRGFPEASSWRCPTTSSRDAGRIWSARGVCMDYSYSGYFSHSSQTLSRTSSALFSKSDAVRYIACAMISISAGWRPRVVTAGVPTRDAAGDERLLRVVGDGVLCDGDEHFVQAAFEFLTGEVAEGTQVNSTDGCLCRRIPDGNHAWSDRQPEADAFATTVLP